MILNTERLHLRPLVETDIPNVQKYFAHWGVIRHLINTVPWPYPDDGAKDFYHSVVAPNQGKDRWFWAINTKENPDYMIGQVELRYYPINEHSNRGFWLGLPYHGKGYMTEAATAVTDFAFSSLGFEQLCTTSAVSNPASRRVKEKQGMRFVKTKKGALPTGGGDQMEDVFIMTRDDWLKLKK